MKFWLRKPDDRILDSIESSQSEIGFSYDADAVKDGRIPTGYQVDFNYTCLGSGESVFRRACVALEHWKQFSLPWLFVYPKRQKIESGKHVLIVAKSFGLWWGNACRIVCVSVEDSVRDASDRLTQADPGIIVARHYGFTYGTLAMHAGTGEERFRVSMDEQGRVYFDIHAFSRPNHMLSRLGYPLMRNLQRKFAIDSMAAMRKAIGASGSAEDQLQRCQSEVSQSEVSLVKQTW